MSFNTIELRPGKIVGIKNQQKNITAERTSCFHLKLGEIRLQKNAHFGELNNICFSCF